MSLNVINNFYANKSIKLSDSFVVEIKLNETGEFYEYYSCTGVTLPKLEQTEEVQTYGNTSQTFLIPNYDSCKELTLEFYEEFDDNTSSKELLFENYKAYHLEQKFSSEIGLSRNEGTYVNRFIPAIKIKIMDNNFHNFYYEYNFERLKIVNYNLYNLDYSDESPCKISITFTFENYTKQFIKEEIEYSTIAASFEEAMAKHANENPYNTGMPTGGNTRGPNTREPPYNPGNPPRSDNQGIAPDLSNVNTNPPAPSDTEQFAKNGANR